MEDGATANPVDSDAIYEVSMPAFVSRANIAGKEAQDLRTDARIPNPPNLAPDREPVLDWEEFYRLAWKDKLIRREEDNR